LVCHLRCANVPAPPIPSLVFGISRAAIIVGWVTFMLWKLREHILDCYERAAECAEQADQASDEIRKSDFINMERSWIHLARSCEYMEELERLLLDSYRDQVQGVDSISN
jgi:hypothetical protein